MHWYAIFRNAAGHKTTYWMKNDHPMEAIKQATTDYARLMRYSFELASDQLIEFGQR